MAYNTHPRISVLGSQPGRSQSGATEGGPHTVYNNSMTPMPDVAQASSGNYSTSNLTLKHRLNERYIVLNKMNTDQESAMRFNPLFERL